jgi:excisionase family DNA binding protein
MAVEHEPDRGSADALLLTPHQAAARLNVSRTTLYELMGSGALGFVRLGRARRIPVVALRAFVAQELQRQGFAS